MWFGKLKPKSKFSATFGLLSVQFCCCTYFDTLVTGLKRRLHTAFHVSGISEELHEYHRWSEGNTSLLWMQPIKRYSYTIAIFCKSMHPKMPYQVRWFYPVLSALLYSSSTRFHSKDFTYHLLGLTEDAKDWTCKACVIPLLPPASERIWTETHAGVSWIYQPSAKIITVAAEIFLALNCLQSRVYQRAENNVATGICSQLPVRNVIVLKRLYSPFKYLHWGILSFHLMDNILGKQL